MSRIPLPQLAVPLTEEERSAYLHRRYRSQEPDAVAARASQQEAAQAGKLAQARAGHPLGRPRFGFRRTADGRSWEPDPEQWPVVQRICHGLASAGNGALLHRQLLAEGHVVSLAIVRQVLRDPIYVSGVLERRFGGEVVGRRQLHLIEPVPSQTFERNQAILSSRVG